MYTVLIIILILFLFVYSAKKAVENEKLRQARKRVHWAKVRYIQSLTPSEREKIFVKNEGKCQRCGAREKLYFHIITENESEWILNNVEIRCSECKGYSLRYDYGRKTPEYAKDLVFERDGGRCINCGTTYNLSYDHIIPFIYGGASSDADNIQLLCSSCNSSKSTSFKY